MNYKGLLCTACLMCLGLFLSAQPTMSINSGDGDPGDSFTAEITVADFTNLVSAQFSINWDPDVLSYESTQDIVSNLDGFTAGSIGDFVGNTENGIITVSWNDPLFEPASLADNSVLFSITFMASGDECDSSFVAFSGSPLSIEVLDETEVNVGLNAENGLFKINGEDCEPVDPEDGGYVIALECGDIEAGSEICIPVIVDSFILINSIQLGLLFDEDVFEFDECQAGELPGFNLANCSSPEPGQIRVIWTDPEVNGSTLDDGATAFSLCFTVIGDIGDMGTIEFSDVPIVCEITDVNGDISSEVTKTGCDYTIVGPMVDELTLIMDTVAGCTGDTVCVAMTVENFECMESLQFGMAFDSNVIRVVGEVLPSDPISGLNSSSFGYPPFTPANNISFVWTFGGSPETLSDGDTLFSMCFVIIGEDGESSSVTIGPAQNFDIEHSGCNGVFSTLDQEIGGVMVDCNNLIDCRDIVITPVLCFGAETGGIDVTIVGGEAPYDFQWSNGAMTEDIVDVGAGEYAVMVTDADGVTETCGPWTITQNEDLVLNELVTITECGGSTGAINTSPTGGETPYSFEWSNSDDNEDLINVAANSYTVTVTDDNLCVYERGPIVVESEFGLEQAIVTNVACMTENTGSIELILCGTATSITWDKDGEFFTVSQQTIDDLEPALYEVTITDGIDTYTESWEITEELDLILSGIVITDENMGGDGAIDITISGGTEPYTYLWSNGATTEDLVNVLGGCYSVNVMDVNGCSTTFSDLCVDSEELVVNTMVTPINCIDGGNGRIVLNPFNGVAPYTYMWEIDSLMGPDVSIGIEGTYQVIITDSNGKSTTLDIEVRRFESSVTSRCAITETSCDGVFTATATGGAEPYSYRWNNNPNENGMELDGVCAGESAVLTVSDANGCVLMNNDIPPMCIGPDVPCFTGRQIITPNDDGKNDALRIACLTGADRLEIFNRVGERVWFMDAYDNTWMGTDLSGADLPDGVYYWVLFVSDNLNQEVFYKGHVTLLRNLD